MLFNDETIQIQTRPETLEKPWNYSSTEKRRNHRGFFLMFLQYFSEQLLYREPVNGSF